MRILVAMANHGTKNERFAARLLDEYRTMTHDVDVVVLSDQPKRFGADVEVLVGAPSSDPRSLPFAHRQLFADRIDDYDLFIYTEDDTLITERHIDAFVEVNDLLPETDVPGFQRFEEYSSGERNYSSVHSTYRWLPRTATVVGGEVFAEHSNLHSACYLLAQSQLRTAIRSGGFLVPPHRGPFWSLMVTAISDVYSQCGLRRRLCVSRIDDFLLHHLPNVYLGILGIGEAEYRTQIGAVLDIGRGALSNDELIEPSSSLDTHIWDVPQHPPPQGPLASISPNVRHPLSVGATNGAVEMVTFPAAEEVTVVPVDEITGAVCRSRGLRTLRPHLSEATAAVPPGGYDGILFHHTLHQFPDPSSVLRELRNVAAPGCDILVTMPNAPHHRLRRIARRTYAGPVPLRGFERDGIHAPGMRFLRKVGGSAGVAWRPLRSEQSRAQLASGGSLVDSLERIRDPQFRAVGRYR